MEPFVALLRGVNVGRGNRVPMAELRALLQRRGYSHVSTLLNSGNAVFCAPAKAAARAEATIAQALADELGVSVPVIVKSSHEWTAAIAANPGPAVDDPSRLLVAFASTPGELENLAGLASLLLPSESFHLASGAAYLHCADGVLESKAAAALLGKLGRGVTTRNWSSVLKIAAVMAGMPDDSSSGKPLHG